MLGAVEGLDQREPDRSSIWPEDDRLNVDDFASRRRL
jgi:hypothetical protein